MSSKPDVVGDLIEFTVAYTPPTGAAPGTKVTAAKLHLLDPTGAASSTDATELSENVWRFVAGARIDKAGTWVVRANANAGLIDSLEFELSIRPSRFATPVP